jgi:hypothetical protein
LSTLVKGSQIVNRKNMLETHRPYMIVGFLVRNSDGSYIHVSNLLESKAYEPIFQPKNPRDPLIYSANIFVTLILYCFMGDSCFLLVIYIDACDVHLAMEPHVVDIPNMLLTPTILN